MLHTQSEPGPPLPSALERYGDELKSVYSRYKLEAIVDWPPPPTENIVKLAMIGDHQIDQEFIGDMTQGNLKNVLKTKMIIEPNQLYKTIESSYGRVILIEGAPGCGKTTLCWHICQQWGNGMLFQQFSHVIMVELRDKYIRSGEDLAGILPYCGAEDSIVAEELKEMNGENVLIILEGWNELPQNLRNDSIFKELVEKGGRAPLQKSVILITSRSNTTVDLYPYIALRVEALGFTTDQIESYVHACFRSKSEPEKAEELLKIIRQNPKLEGNCYLPLILIIIVHLYDRQKTLPESFCGIIIELALSCLYRYCKDKKLLSLYDEMSSFSNIPREIKGQFVELCKLAYKATMEEKYSFSSPKMAGLGLLQNVRSLAGRGCSTTQYFLHSSLQELCAALHIQNTKTNNIEMLQSLFEVPYDYVLRFYSALTHWEDPRACNVLLEHSRAIQDKAQKHILLPAKPEPLTQTMIEVPNMMFQSIIKILMLLGYIMGIISGHKEFDREYLISILNICGTEDMEDCAREQAEIVEDLLMKMADSSFNPADSPRMLAHLFEQLKKPSFTTMEQISSKAGMNTANVLTAGLVVQEELGEMIIALTQKIPEFIQEIVESFETDEVPDEVLCEQLAQKLQQYFIELYPNPVSDNQQQQLQGFPVSPQQKVSHDAQLVYTNTYHALGKDTRLFQNLAKIMVSITFKGDFNPTMFLEFFGQNVIKHIRSKTLVENRLKTQLVHGERACNMLMLLHCVYEAQNPTLTQALGSSFEISGELNTSDLLALQSTFEIKQGSKCAWNLKDLHLFSSIADISCLANAIEVNSTITTLKLDVGFYHKELVSSVLRKQSIKRFRYNWLMRNDRDRVNSCKSLCLLLKQNRNLQALELLGADISDFGAKCLARILNTTRLVEIDLSRCEIEEEGIIALSSALASNNYLKIMHINDNLISPAALKKLSHALKQNNTLQVIGMVDEPATSQLRIEHFQEFILQLCFNSSVTCVLLNGSYIHATSLVQAVTFVNFTRKLKQRPHLSVDDHYTKNCNIEIYNDLGIQENDIRMKSINCSVVKESDGCYLMKTLPVQVWTQTLPFSIQFIDDMKTIRNASMRMILKPSSKAILINVHSQSEKPTTYEGMVSQHTSHQVVSFQERQQTLCSTLEFIQRTKSIRNMTMRLLVPPSLRSRMRMKKHTTQINIHIPNHTSQYPAVIHALEKEHPFSTQEWQQTLFCVQQFIDKSKHIRNMSMRKLLQTNRQTIDILLTVQQYNIREFTELDKFTMIYSDHRVSVILTTVEHQLKCYGINDYVHSTQCLNVLLSVLTNRLNDVGRSIQSSVNPLRPTTIQLHQENFTLPLPQVINANKNSNKITFCMFHIPSSHFDILLDNVLCYISSLLKHHS